MPAATAKTLASGLDEKPFVGAAGQQSTQPRGQAMFLPLRFERGDRAVYELEFSPAGRCAFHLVTSTGEVGYVDVPASWPDLVRNLWKELDRVDPVAKLHLVANGREA